jgi:hypothetical protein
VVGYADQSHQWYPDGHRHRPNPSRNGAHAGPSPSPRAARLAP